MKIANITNKGRIYSVELVPNFFERLIGIKPKTVEYKDTYSTFTYGGGSVYIREDGYRTGNGDWIPEAIDKWRNSSDRW